MPDMGGGGGGGGTTMHSWLSVDGWSLSCFE